MEHVDKQQQEAFDNELTELLKKYNYQFSVRLTFPQYNILPDYIKLALKVIEKEEGQYQIEYTPLTPAK